VTGLKEKMTAFSPLVLSREGPLFPYRQDIVFWTLGQSSHQVFSATRASPFLLVVRGFDHVFLRSWTRVFFDAIHVSFAWISRILSFPASRLSVEEVFLPRARV